MIKQYSRELSPAVEKEIWKQLKRGNDGMELIQMALDDGLSIIDAERVVGEMRMAVQLVGNARSESLSTRLGLIYGPPMALGGMLVTGLIIFSGLRLPWWMKCALLSFSIFALVFGVVSTRRAWSSR